MIRILIVDDHAAFRQPLAFMLQREPDLLVVGQAGSLAEARTMLKGVDVAIVDIDLVDGNGLDLVPEVRRANMLAMVLVLTGHTDRVQVARAVDAGASGVLHKSAGVEQVVTAVRRLSAGEPLVTHDEAVELSRVATERRARDRAAQSLIDTLTPREHDVLAALAQGMSDKEIAVHLHIGSETVRTHMVNILSKLDVSSRLQALVFALRHGVVEID